MECPTDRQERISGWRQDLLESARVGIMGAGALGNETLKNLALLGVRNFHIFDFDVVEVSNLSRTVLFSPASLGQPKASVAAARTKDFCVAPDAITTGHSVDIVWGLGAGYLRRLQIVLGCLDNLEARLAVGRTCYKYQVPFIDGGIRELGGRVQMHKTGMGACMECTIGSGERTELLRRYACGPVMKSYVEQRIVPTVQVSSAITAALMCQEAIKHIQAKAVPFGSVISWFGETNDFGVLRLEINPLCQTCSVPPVTTVRELPLGIDDSAGELLHCAENGAQFILPSPFILKLTCSKCGTERELWKAAHECRDTEIYCLHCGAFEADEIALRQICTISAASPNYAKSLTLRRLGFAPLSIVSCLVEGEEVGVFELTKDLQLFPELQGGI